MPTGLLLAATLGLGLLVLSGRIERGVEADLSVLSRYHALLFDSYLRKAAKVADAAATVLAARPSMNEAELYALLRRNLQQEPLVYGSAIAFETDAFPGRRLFSPYVHRQGDTVRQMDIAAAAYDYTDPAWDWFNLPKRLRRAVWTEPYFDEGAGNILMSTYSVPVLRGDRLFAVVTVDIPLLAIRDQLSVELAALDNFLVLSSSGRFVYNSYAPKLIGEPAPAAEWFQDHGRPDLAGAFGKLMRTKRGSLRVPGLGQGSNGAGQWLFFSPIGAADWLFVAGIDQARALEPVHDAAYAGVALVASMLALMLVVTWLASGPVTRRVARVQRTAVRIADGDFTARTDVSAPDEIGGLAAAVDTMAAHLAERERQIVEINRGLEDTVRRRTLELAAKSELLATVFRSMNEGIVAFDGELRLLAWNEPYFRIRGYPAAFAVEGRAYEDFVRHDVARDEFGEGNTDEIVEKVLEQARHSEPHAFERQRPDGTWVEVRGGPIQGGGFVSTYADISERKRADEDIRRALSIIRESVDYASNIQRSLLPVPKVLEELFRDHFVIWQPRDVVGGDFYWLRECERGRLLVVCDCTGHGVPGAFMTIIGTAALDQALTAHPDGEPSALLAYMNGFVRRTLLQDSDEGHADDGMEIGICRLEAGRISFAGARFTLLAVDRQGGCRLIKGDRQGIGYRRCDPDARFTNHVIAPGDDTYYLLTDGLVDQIGGEKRRAFGRRRLLRLLAGLQRLPMSEQKTAILESLGDYQGAEPRRDDVTVCGFRP